MFLVINPQVAGAAPPLRRRRRVGLGQCCLRWLRRADFGVAGVVAVAVAATGAAAGVVAGAVAVQCCWQAGVAAVVAEVVEVFESFIIFLI